MDLDFVYAQVLAQSMDTWTYSGKRPAGPATKAAVEKLVKEWVYGD